ncbi:MAG: hypothetical protein WC497_05455 [Patescibacteria group bacterium]
MVKKTTAVETTEPVKPAPLSLEDKILVQASMDAVNLLKSDWPQIYQAYRKAHIESGEEKFAFNIGLGIKLQPEASDVKVTVKAAWSIKYEDETEPATVSNQPDMFRA